VTSLIQILLQTAIFTGAVEELNGQPINICKCSHGLLRTSHYMYFISKLSILYNYQDALVIFSHHKNGSKKKKKKL